MESLNAVEQAQAKTHQRFIIRGKGCQAVPCILNLVATFAMNVLVDNRKSCNVYNFNPYLYARPNSKKHIRGYEALRFIAETAGIEFPERIRTTNLRRHIATMLSLMALDEHELYLAAKILGHDLSVHRNTYRQDSPSMQIARLSRIFAALQSGQGQKYVGKKLTDIPAQTEIEEVIDEESDNSDDEGEVTIFFFMIKLCNI
jgi:hypothetical protein